MDAPNPSSTVTFANRTPLRIGAVGLKARDLSRLTDYYTQAIGLDVLDRDSKTARLGAGGVTLLELEAAPNAAPDDPRTAGLYHTAFLQPTRGDLARWLVHAAQNRVPLTGASDHLVSEAIYLDDPEGNGIEVYRDRLPEEWRWSGDRIQMATDRLNLDQLAADAGNTAYAGAPARPARRPHSSARRRPRADAAILLRHRRAQSDRGPRRRAVHVVRALPSSRRQQCLAFGRRRTSATTIAPDCHGSRLKPPMRRSAMALWRASRPRTFR